PPAFSENPITLNLVILFLLWGGYAIQPWVYVGGVDGRRGLSGARRGSSSSRLWTNDREQSNHFNDQQCNRVAQLRTFGSRAAETGGGGGAGWWKLRERCRSSACWSHPSSN